MTDKYVAQLKAQHHKAQECVILMHKLTATLDESTYEAGRFFTTDHWKNIMEEMQQLPDIEWEGNIEEIVKISTNAAAQLSQTDPSRGASEKTEELIRSTKDKFPKGRIEN